MDLAAEGIASWDAYTYNQERVLAVEEGNKDGVSLLTSFKQQECEYLQPITMLELPRSFPELRAETLGYHAKQVLFRGTLWCEEWARICLDFFTLSLDTIFFLLLKQNIPHSLVFPPVLQRIP